MTRAATNARFAERFVAALVGHGVREAVASPGSRNTPLVLALHARPDVRVHTLVDERVAGFVALGLARAGGHPVALVCTSGSAGAHYLPALIEARASRVGLVAVTADRPPELHGCGAPQTTPQETLFGPHAVDRLSVGPPDDAEAAEALEPRLASLLDGTHDGPVHVNVSFREPLWAPEVRYGAPAPSPHRLLRGRRTLDPRDLAGLAADLRRARGAIVCGPRASGRADPLRFARAVSALARHLGWPILAGPTSGLRFGPHDTEHVVACGDALLRSEAFTAGARADVVLRLGQIPTSKSIQRWLSHAESLLLVDPWGDRHDPTGHAETLVVADATWLCEELRRDSSRPPAGDGAWLERWLRAERAARAALSDASDAGFWEGGIARTLIDALPSGALLHVASSMPIRDVDAFSPPTAKALTVLASRGVNGIDGTLATACGEALAWDGPSAVLLGDLACLHDAGSLLALRALGVNTTIVVINNGGGGIFSFLPIAAHTTDFERAFLTPRPLNLESLCAAAGVPYARATSLAELRSRVGGLRVVEAIVDREENVNQHKAAWEAAVLAVDSSYREDLCPTTG